MPVERLQELGVVGPGGRRGQQLPGPGHGRHQDLVVAPEVVDLGRHLDRVVEQLLEQAVGALGELDVLVPGVAEARRGPRRRRAIQASRSAVTSAAAAWKRVGGVPQLAPLGADAVVGGGATELRYRAWGPPGSGECGVQDSRRRCQRSPIWRTREASGQGFPSQFLIKPIVRGDQWAISRRRAHPLGGRLGHLGQHVVGGPAAGLQRPVAVVGGVDPVEGDRARGWPWPPVVRAACPASESRVPLTNSTGTRMRREVLGPGLLGLPRGVQRIREHEQAERRDAGRRRRRPPSSSSARPSTARRAPAARAGAWPAWPARPRPRASPRRAPSGGRARCGRRCGTGS